METDFQTRDYTTFSGDVEKVEALSKVFPVFFYLVAALVSLTTMTRLVEEKRGEIGILRSLGYSMSAVMIYYILYACTCIFGRRNSGSCYRV